MFGKPVNGMFHKLQVRLTLICVITTGILLNAMAVLLLWMSGIQMDNQREITFQNSINSIVYRIQSSRVIDDAWLSQLEAGNHLIVHIEDNAVPILFQGSWTPATSRTELIDAAQEKALSKYQFDVKIKPYSVINTETLTFELDGDYGDHYQAAVVTIPSSYGWQSLTLLRDINQDIQERWMLRIISFVIIIVALILLFLFSWWFSKKAIEPIEIINQKQVEFIAAASHELRSPLSVICASLSVIDADCCPEMIQKYTATANRECMRMSHLIDDLLFLASADALTWSIQSEAIEVDTFLTELYESYEPIVSGNKQKLSLILPDELLPTLRGDKQRLWQAISILLENATFYTPEGGQIRMEVFRLKNTLSISISDNGIGIPEQEKEKVFDRFYRADSSHSEKGHYGLGLSVAKEIIELHKGSIQISDTPGGGTTFIITLYI